MYSTDHFLLHLPIGPLLRGMTRNFFNDKLSVSDLWFDTSFFTTHNGSWDEGKWRSSRVSVGFFLMTYAFWTHHKNGSKGVCSRPVLISTNQSYSFVRLHTCSKLSIKNCSFDNIKFHQLFCRKSLFSTCPQNTLNGSRKSVWTVGCFRRPCEAHMCTFPQHVRVRPSGHK